MRSTPTVLGVLSIVFGGTHAVWTGVTLLSQPYNSRMMSNYGKMFAGLPHSPQGPDPKVMFERIARMTDELRPYILAASLPLIVYSIALVFVGIQLYQRRPRSRPLALAWAAAALAFVPILLYIQLRVILPRTADVMNGMFADMPEQTRGMMRSISLVQMAMTFAMYLVLYVPFPVVMMILMGRASAKDDLVAPAPPA